ncbi:uncharacterized protein ARMOST_20673 [Armillaria ostoyae]|uniref:Uncharacterized protein n=1 Tax=Armillaria ostoyae TaxID=47428 RepID=A0A284S836_ARMOS|nr:uncharacterized protein ARMOST_20673 [Armillaria ostoyae]
MEVDGSVFRKKHGRFLVPWLEGLVYSTNYGSSADISDIHRRAA